MTKCTFLGSQEIVAVFRLNFHIFLFMVNRISHLALKRVIYNYSSSQSIAHETEGHDSEAMRARGIFVLVKSNQLVKDIGTKQL